MGVLGCALAVSFRLSVRPWATACERQFTRKLWSTATPMLLAFSARLLPRISLFMRR